MSYLLGILLRALSLIYGLIVNVRNRLYDKGILKTKRAENTTVICIGNITAGGTGKTPAVQYYARKYMEEGRKVGILSRGYKGKRDKDMLLVSDGCEIKATPLQAGDEAYLHALNINVPVLVSKDRYAGAVYLRDMCKVDTIIMDDGFQHRKLYKDKSIILIDATNPFGGDCYLPEGRLREPLSSLERADEVIVTRSNYVSRQELENIAGKLRKYGKPLYYASFYEECFYSSEREKAGLEKIKGRKVLIFSSIARPEVFYRTVERIGPSEIKEMNFPDHHIYSPEEISRIYKEGKTYDYIVTTEKDIVKIGDVSPKLLILKMGFEVLADMPE